MVVSTILLNSVQNDALQLKVMSLHCIDLSNISFDLPRSHMYLRCEPYSYRSKYMYSLGHTFIASSKHCFSSLFFVSYQSVCMNSNIFFLSLRFFSSHTMLLLLYDNIRQWEISKSLSYGGRAAFLVFFFKFIILKDMRLFV